MNILIEKYGEHKRKHLQESPFNCLLSSKIEHNPHQLDAFCAAINALKTGGIILADEVGLGKTIEAGLVLRYLIQNNKKHLLIVLPSALRMQWKIELQEKFDIKETEIRILTNYDVKRDYYDVKNWLEEKNKLRIVLCSYDFSSKLIKRFNKVMWDCVFIDEAHNLRNVFRGTKRAKNLYETTKGIPKVLLTATPLQNSLKDLHGLVSYIDDRIFGDQRLFEKKYEVAQNYRDLKECLKPVLYRTLRKDVKYLKFTNRNCFTCDFTLTKEEKALYVVVNNFLKKDNLYAFPSGNIKNFIILVIRKLLASSSKAVIETFEVIKDRLEKLYEGTKSQDAQEGFELFWQFAEDEIEDTIVEQESEDVLIRKEQIQKEIDEVDNIISIAEEIKTNAKVGALKQAIELAFEEQSKLNIENKVVVFTESKRTQKYIAKELRSEGFEDDDILIFNGDTNDELSKKIYKAWQVKNFGNVDYGRSVEFKHAIVDYFKNNAKVLILTDAGAEGLNLQFCNTIINFDLPWNPQRIEQRIGRCHRYGQQNDVLAINFLNIENAADKRVYDILTKKFELFSGVFGASDSALGILESGSNFESKILDIYQKCNNAREFEAAFDKLEKEIDKNRGSIGSRVKQLKTILSAKTSEEKVADIESTKSLMEQYLDDVEFWNNIPPVHEAITTKPRIYQVQGDTSDYLLEYGYVFVGQMFQGNVMSEPILVACDDDGRYFDLTEKEIVDELLKIPQEKLKWTSKSDYGVNKTYHQIADDLTNKVNKRFKKLEEYNTKKVNNWMEIQKEQLNLDIADKKAEIEEMRQRERWSNNIYEKADIRKEIEKKQKSLEDFQAKYMDKVAKIEEDGKKEIEKFNKNIEATPILVVDFVVKF